MFRSLGFAIPLALAGLACGARVERPRLVVLVSVDTLRADHLGLYGYERPTSPVLDALARESTVFEQAMSASPWTLPSHATLLTGLYPSRHGLTSHERYLSSSLTTLAQYFSQAGYRTAAVVNSHNLSPEFGLDRGFQQYRYVEERTERREPSTEITDQGVEWIRGAGKDPLFLFLHYYDVHSDYASLPEYEREFLRPYDGIADGTTAQLALYREGKVSLSPADAPRLIDRYDAGIRQMDQELGRLLSFLREGGPGEKALLLVTSDHGEEFFEHGGVLHGQTQYQEVLRVPLLIRGPGVPAGRRVPTPVSLIDVVPTLLTLAGIGTPEGLDGLDLAPLWSEGGGRLEERYLFSEADHNNVEHDITRSVRYRGFKLHYNRLSRERRLYDLARDPEERKDISSGEGKAMAALSQRLDRFMAMEKVEAPVRALSEEEIEKLRSLGYLR
ncbi:MAG TPA: sulfatase [Vicinamibacteria bacterium]|jgi:arylsulfatase A-like enzyme